MARQYKGVYCGELIAETENKIPVKSRYAHERCFNVSLKATDKKQKEAKQKKLAERKNTSETARKSTKPVQELREGLTEEEYQEKKKLFNKIREIQGSEELTAKTYALVDNYYTKNKYSYSDIYKALIWKYDLMPDDGKDHSDIVGFIPYYIDEALRYFKESEQVSKYNKTILKNLNHSDLYKSKTIKIKPQTSEFDEIDITKIGRK